MLLLILIEIPFSTQLFEYEGKELGTTVRQDEVWNPPPGKDFGP